jgi:putative DNA primase/helicase
MNATPTLLNVQNTHNHEDDNEMPDKVYSELERFCLARIQLLNNGYEPIPTRGKRPAVMGWTTGEITEERVVRETIEYDDALNTGLRTGHLVGIDIDIVDQDHVSKLLQIVVDKIGYSPLFRYGSKGMMVCCQNPEPISKLTITGVQPNGTTRGVEILGQGNQFM